MKHNLRYSTRSTNTDPSVRTVPTSSVTGVANLCIPSISNAREKIS